MQAADTHDPLLNPLPLAGEEANEKSDYKSLSAESPCIGHCTTVLGDEVCRSCLRTFDEITRWIEMNDDERRAVNLRIAQCGIRA
jgi:predicted Fe-S protein YdhL (DUF1289 family)